MIDPIVIQRLREKYCNIHPLIFHRSVQKAKSNGDLFDILSTIPEKYPINWSQTERRWVTVPEINLNTDLLKI